MVFIINNMKYDTDKMEKVANVKKWYKVDNIFSRVLYGGEEMGRYYPCELWRSKKGNWLLTHEEDCKVYGQAISEFEAQSLLMTYDTEIYEKKYGEIPEA